MDHSVNCHIEDILIRVLKRDLTVAQARDHILALTSEAYALGKRDGRWEAIEEKHEAVWSDYANNER